MKQAGSRIVPGLVLAVVVVAAVLLVAGYGLAVGVGLIVGLLVGASVGLVGVLWLRGGTGRSITFGLELPLRDIAGEWAP
jgi:hypothetical protein